MVLCPYWANIRRWISTGFTLSALRNRNTPRCSSMVQSCKGGSMFSPSLLPLDWRRSAVLHMAELFNRRCQYCAMRQLLSVPVTRNLKIALTFWFTLVYQLATAAVWKNKTFLFEKYTERRNILNIIAGGTHLKH